MVFCARHAFTAALSITILVATVEGFLLANNIGIQGQSTNPATRTPNIISKLSALSKQELQAQREKQKAFLRLNEQYFAPPKSKTKTSGTDDDKTSQYSVKYITSNIWPRSSFGRKMKQQAARTQLHGVEIRPLEEPHPLAGELGLFVTVAFQQFDILGEYCGLVFDEDDGGHYATYLEDRTTKHPLGVDAQLEGNECRYINTFQGIADQPNVVMKIAYVEELPRVMMVATRDISVGEEILSQYSDEYVKEYIG